MVSETMLRYALSIIGSEEKGGKRRRCECRNVWARGAGLLGSCEFGQVPKRGVESGGGFAAAMSISLHSRLPCSASLMNRSREYRVACVHYPSSNIA